METTKDITERQRIEEALYLNELQVHALLQLNEMAEQPMQMITDFALEKAIELTRSKIGYLAFVNADETLLTTHSWPKERRAGEPRLQTYPVVEAGRWVEAVRQRRAVIVNQNAPPASFEKGALENVEPVCYMDVPVFEGERIVAVAGVANKETPYDENDVRQLMLLMLGMWRLLQRKQGEDRLRAAAEALRRSETYLAEAQKLTHTGSWADDGSVRPAYWSEELYRIFGLDPKEGVPERNQPLERIHPEDRDRFLQAFDRAIHQKVDAEVEFRIVLPDGTVKYAHGIGHPVLNANGNLVEIVGTTVDITERKRAEEERTRLHQLEADLAHINRVSMMGELTASIAHEVNQPLSGVVSNGSACLRWLAGDEPNLEEAREAARRIVRDGKRAGEIIARIRALTKRAAEHRERLDLNETIREVLPLVGDEAKKRNVIIRTCFAEEIFPVIGDRVQLQQVVLNLVMNGLEAMSAIMDGPRELVITCRNADQDCVEVTIRDSGVGLDPDETARIFDAFYTTKPTGMGMGLSISRSIIHAHGGRLGATANDGPGTTFHFTLPRKQDEADAARARV
jgi:PAS domain S-box-containing protein